MKTPRTEFGVVVPATVHPGASSLVGVASGPVQPNAVAWPRPCAPPARVPMRNVMNTALPLRICSYRPESGPQDAPDSHGPAGDKAERQVRELGVRPTKTDRLTREWVPVILVRPPPPVRIACATRRVRSAYGAGPGDQGSADRGFVTADSGPDGRLQQQPTRNAKKAARPSSGP